MPLPQIKLSGILTDQLHSVGVHIDDLLHAIGIAPGSADGGRLALAPVQFYRLWRQIEQSGVPESFGLTLARNAHSYQFDVASMAALHCATLGEGLAILARYKRLTCPEEIVVDVAAGEASVAVHWLGDDTPTPPMLVDSALAWIAALADRGAVTPVQPLRVELMRRDKGPKTLREFFKCPVHFNAGRDALVYEASVLAQPFKTRNRDVLELMIPGLDDALGLLATGPSILVRVRHALRKAMQGRRPTVQSVARELCVSPRTLQRHLETEGTGFQKLLDEVRQETARQLLGRTDLDIGEIAFLLGYEEMNSFSRAFGAWEGQSPLNWRQSRLHEVL